MRVLTGKTASQTCKRRRSRPGLHAAVLEYRTLMATFVELGAVSVAAINSSGEVVGDIIPTTGPFLGYLRDTGGTMDNDSATSRRHR